MGKENVITDDASLRVYQYDASLETALPDAVILPCDAQQVSHIVQLADKEGIPYLPRGSGTNLSGGSIPVRGGIVIEFSRMNRILETDPANHRVLVEPGVYNLELQERLARDGFFYPPDPASQRVSSLGGNMGENSGGPHCLKYGVTTNHVLGLEAVLPSGEVIDFGGESLQHPGYDITGLLVGSEGTLAIITKAWLRILPLQEGTRSFLTVFDSIEDAARAVTSIIKRGIVPAAMEMMDRPIINAVEDSVHAGYPRDAESVLIIDVDGPRDEADAQAGVIEEICLNHNAREVRGASDESERDKIWAGRRGAFGAVARITPNYLVTDCTVPRTELPSVLARIAQISLEAGLPIGNVFHAGDGNLHPLILFDDRNSEERSRADAAGKEIMEICAAAGGTISGEHGIGLEKKEAMSLVFNKEETKAMRLVKKAFDPAGILNPDKIFPDAKPDESDTSSPLPHTDKTFEKELLDLLEAERVHIPDEGSEDCRVGNIMPRAVLYPETEEEISEVVRLAAAHGAALIPKGNGSKTLRAGIPDRADAILSLRGLDGIKMLDGDNFVTTVQAGMTYACLQNSLRQHGLWLPLMPFYASRATIGGMAATGDSGFPNPHINSLRDLVLGMRVIMADGRRTHFGGVTMKNVAGYDMCKLFLGSYGTLGILTDVTLKLAPLPEDEATLLIAADGLSHALDYCTKFFGICDLKSTIELMNHESAREVLIEAGLEEIAERFHCLHSWAVILHCSGSGSGAEAALNRYRKLLDVEQAGESLALDGGITQTLKEKRSGFFETIGEESALAFQVSTTKSGVEEVIQKALSLACTHRHKVKIACSPTGGTAGIIFTPENGEASKEKSHQLIVDAIQRFLESGCSYHLEHAPLNLLGLVEAWHSSSRNLNVMKSIKEAFDPQTILNPGKLIPLH